MRLCCVDARFRGDRRACSKIERVCDITCIVLLEGRDCTSSSGVVELTAQMLDSVDVVRVCSGLR